jgi:formamidopyrimidine-DNA glycosylase
MPELPDVEAYRRILARNGLKKRIAAVVVDNARILGKLSAARFRARLEGRRLLETRRHGKHLLARIEEDGWLTLHFGMTGRLDAFARLEAAPRFLRIRFDFAGNGHLAYVNKRMLGRVGLAEDADAFIASEALGPDVLDRRFDLAAFEAALAGSRRDIKSALMDQGAMAGIGNIYADEILFHAGIRPMARADRLSPAQLKRLHAEMRKVLAAAVKRGAGSEEFVERAPKGWLLPERRKGGRCPRCHAPLQLAKSGGRTGYYCPRDQR